MVNFGEKNHTIRKQPRMVFLKKGKGIKRKIHLEENLKKVLIKKQQLDHSLEQKKAHINTHLHENLNKVPIKTSIKKECLIEAH